MEGNENFLEFNNQIGPFLIAFMASCTIKY